MRPVHLAACLALLACASGPRSLDDPEADLDEPVTAWAEGLGKTVFDRGVVYQFSPFNPTLSIYLAPGLLECSSTEPPTRFVALNIDLGDLERPAENTSGGNPISFVFGEEWANATQGWVRIDERSDDTVQGAMSWLSEDEDGATVAWAEGAFTLVPCDG